jgi:multicomponent K+:H+ antiporter subunit D
MADDELEPPKALAFAATGGLVALLVAHTVFAGYAHDYMIATSQQLFAPEPYISAVLDAPGKLSSSTGEDH